jgi:hypothetical protein
MQFNDIVDTIELTDSDHLADALDIFNTQGVVHANNLPFLNVVYENAAHVLLKKLNQIGFKGDAQLAKCSDGDYAIFNADKLSENEAISKLK